MYLIVLETKLGEKITWFYIEKNKYLQILCGACTNRLLEVPGPYLNQMNSIYGFEYTNGRVESELVSLWRTRREEILRLDFVDETNSCSGILRK